MGCFTDSLVLFRNNLLEGCKNDVPNRGVDYKERWSILLSFGDLWKNTLMILFLLRHGGDEPLNEPEIIDGVVKSLQQPVIAILPNLLQLLILNKRCRCDVQNDQFDQHASPY
ncbi:hypothetical protein Tco_0974497 [Tanacetum coccineum]|uniref:Uncharacterized protein n=1 Tax=Tanacetum coccineum TaxID=301880 RepID=A0ABQ5EBQ6_9ASTR